MLAKPGVAIPYITRRLAVGQKKTWEIGGSFLIADIVMQARR